MATTRESNTQSTECDPNKTWSPQKRDRFIFKFFALMYFNSSWPEMSFIDMMTNSLLEIWNLVWTKPQTGQATTKGFAIYIIVLGHNKSSPFSSPGFLTRFCPRNLLRSFRWFHNISFHGLHIKKFTDANSLNNAKQHNVNWICKCLS